MTESRMIQVRLNGKDREIAGGQTVRSLLESLELHPGMVVVELNRDIMARFRDDMRPYYFDPDRYDTYLEQLGVQYPTLRAPDGVCRIGAVS